MENISKFFSARGPFETGREAVEFKAAVNWVNSSEFNRIHNRSYAISKVIVTFASEGISDTGRQKKGLGMAVSRGRGEAGHVEPVGDEAMPREREMVIVIKAIFAPSPWLSVLYNRNCDLI